jgi:hypothetical protein
VSEFLLRRNEWVKDRIVFRPFGTIGMFQSVNLLL